MTKHNYPALDELDVMYTELGSWTAVADKLEIPRKTLRDYYNRTKDAFVYPDLPSSELPIDDIVAYRKKRFKKMKEARAARKLIQLKVPVDGPIAIAFVGDPHLDNDGTDIELAFEHAGLIRETKGMYAMNVGDNLDLWPGRMAQLYQHSSTTSDEGWRLLEHYIGLFGHKWLALVFGNHDHWAGAGSPMDYFLRDANAYSDPYDVRLQLNFSNGQDTKIHMRHDFAGHSQWNSIHGIGKEAKTGSPFDIFVAGHKHFAAYWTEYRENQGSMFHAIRASSYKSIDDYADKLGFKEGAHCPCPVAVIDPYSDDDEAHNRITVFLDTDHGADFLTYLRKKRGFEV